MDHDSLVQVETKKIQSILSNFKIFDQIEILANVLIWQGFSKINAEIDNITPENIVEIVMNDKKKNGETLHNALAHQGLVMLMWLRNK